MEVRPKRLWDVSLHLFCVLSSFTAPFTFREESVCVNSNKVISHYFIILSVRFTLSSPENTKET